MVVHSTPSLPVADAVPSFGTESVVLQRTLLIPQLCVPLFLGESPSDVYPYIRSLICFWVVFPFGFVLQLDSLTVDTFSGNCRLRLLVLLFTYVLISLYLVIITTH